MVMEERGGILLGSAGIPLIPLRVRRKLYQHVLSRLIEAASLPNDTPSSHNSSSTRAAIFSTNPRQKAPLASADWCSRSSMILMNFSRRFHCTLWGVSGFIIVASEKGG